MRRALLLLGLLLAAPAAQSDTADFTRIERGRYLATVGDCTACHRGPMGDYAGGRPIETPFGNIMTPNITPDEETGLGRWTEDEFARALHQGIDREGNRLYPAFPYPWYTRVSREDVDAIFAFLRTLPPVKYRPPESDLPFPLNIRASVRAWNLLNFEAGRFQPDPRKDAEWNRGAYLVEGLGHCGACHTPRNFMGGDESGAAYRGGPLQGWYAPNLTNDQRFGLGSWSVEEIVTYLRTGHNERGAASGPMAEAVDQSTSRMTQPDLRAIAVYLKSLPPNTPSAATPLAAEEPRMRRGQALYVDNCSACHKQDGGGIEYLFPRLAGSQVVQQPGPDTLTRIVLSGVRSVATAAEPTAPGMPAFHWRLDDQQTADVLTYIRNSWGNAAPPVTPGNVRDMRGSLASQPE